MIGLLIALVLNANAAFAQPLKVLAAENFYGDIARQMGGDDVEVHSVLNNPGQDPHAFEVSPSLARDVADANIVILNGAGYDPWMERLLEGTTNPGRRVINVAAVTGHKMGDNPHLWFDLATAHGLAKALADELAALRPESADRYRQQEKAFSDSLKPIEDGNASIAQAHKGVSVAATEPVFGYMLQAMGLSVQEKNFQVAVMNEVEPAVSDVARFESDLKSEAVKLLVHNAQTSSPLAEKMIALAQANDIPVLAVRETMPPDKTYQAWLLESVQGVAKALEANH